MNKIEALIAELICGDDKRAEVAASELVSFGKRAIPALLHLLESEQEDIRWWAIRTLAEIQDECIPPVLIESLNDPDETIRHCAALALRYHPNEAAIPTLIAALNSPDSLLAQLAADALIAIGKSAVEPLIEVVQGSNQSARLEAVRALAKIADTRAIPTLYAVLDENSAALEYWANEGLERMGVGMLYFKP